MSWVVFLLRDGRPASIRQYVCIATVTGLVGLVVETKVVHMVLFFIHAIKGKVIQFYV
jgi:hypothetical protein